MKPKALKDSRWKAGDFVKAVKPDDLVYFCCNIGDADAQVLLLPQGIDGVRRCIVVDAGATGKIPRLLQALETAGLVSFADPDAATIALVVATHPHNDHIVGMDELLRIYGQHVAEFWEPGFFHTAPAYQNMMNRVAELPQVVYTQPTSGMQRFFGPVGVTVLSPSIHLRNRFDTYGVEINDSSISLRIEHPARVLAVTASIGGSQHNWAPDPKSATLLLGADAQTLSWSFVATDFPFLAESKSPAAKAIKAATGGKDLLKADVLKVSHHASKHGVNLELVERIKPALTIVSSTAGGRKYGFPHDIAQEILREALDPQAQKGGTHKSDEELKILYTCDTTSSSPATTLGSFAVILNGARRQVWRFGDKTTGTIALANARRWQ